MSSTMNTPQEPTVGLRWNLSWIAQEQRRMGVATQRIPLSRRTFLRVVRTASGAALASGLTGFLW